MSHDQRDERIENQAQNLRAAMDTIAKLRTQVAKRDASNAALVEALGDARAKLLFDVHDAREAVRAEMRVDEWREWAALVLGVPNDGRDDGLFREQVGDRLRTAERERDEAVALLGLRDTVPVPGSSDMLDKVSSACAAHRDAKPDNGPNCPDCGRHDYALIVSLAKAGHRDCYVPCGEPRCPMMAAIRAADTASDRVETGAV